MRKRMTEEIEIEMGTVKVETVNVAVTENVNVPEAETEGEADLKIGNVVAVAEAGAIERVVVDPHTGRTVDPHAAAVPVTAATGARHAVLSPVTVHASAGSRLGLDLRPAVVVAVEAAAVVEDAIAGQFRRSAILAT